MKTKRANHAVDVNGKDINVARPPREVCDEVIKRLARDKVRRPPHAAVKPCCRCRVRLQKVARTFCVACVAVKEQNIKAKVHRQIHQVVFPADASRNLDAAARRCPKGQQ